VWPLKREHKQSVRIFGARTNVNDWDGGIENTTLIQTHTRTLRPRLMTACGREEMSTTARESASSRGQNALANRTMPRRSPRASSNALRWMTSRQRRAENGRAVQLAGHVRGFRRGHCPHKCSSMPCCALPAQRQAAILHAMVIIDMQIPLSAGGER